MERHLLSALRDSPHKEEFKYLLIIANVDQHQRKRIIRRNLPSIPLLCEIVGRFMCVGVRAEDEDIAARRFIARHPIHAFLAHSGLVHGLSVVLVESANLYHVICEKFLDRMLVEIRLLRSLTSSQLFSTPPPSRASSMSSLTSPSSCASTPSRSRFSRKRKTTEKSSSSPCMNLDDLTIPDVEELEKKMSEVGNVSWEDLSQRFTEEINNPQRARQVTMEEDTLSINSQDLEYQRDWFNTFVEHGEHINEEADGFGTPGLDPLLPRSCVVLVLPPEQPKESKAKIIEIVEEPNVEQTFPEGEQVNAAMAVQFSQQGSQRVNSIAAPPQVRQAKNWATNEVRAHSSPKPRTSATITDISHYSTSSLGHSVAISPIPHPPSESRAPAGGAIHPSNPPSTAYVDDSEAGPQSGPPKPGPLPPDAELGIRPLNTPMEPVSSRGQPLPIHAEPELSETHPLHYQATPDPQGGLEILMGSPDPEHPIIKINTRQEPQETPHRHPSLRRIRFERPIIHLDRSAAFVKAMMTQTQGRIRIKDTKVKEHIANRRYKLNLWPFLPNLFPKNAPQLSIIHRVELNLEASDIDTVEQLSDSSDTSVNSDTDEGVPRRSPVDETVFGEQNVEKKVHEWQYRNAMTPPADGWPRSLPLVMDADWWYNHRTEGNEWIDFTEGRHKPHEPEFPPRFRFERPPVVSDAMKMLFPNWDSLRHPSERPLETMPDLHHLSAPPQEHATAGTSSSTLPGQGMASSVIRTPSVGGAGQSIISKGSAAKSYGSSLFGLKTSSTSGGPHVETLPSAGSSGLQLPPVGEESTFQQGRFTISTDGGLPGDTLPFTPHTKEKETPAAAATGVQAADGAEEASVHNVTAAPAPDVTAAPVPEVTAAPVQEAAHQEFQFAIPAPIRPRRSPRCRARRPPVYREESSSDGEGDRPPPRRKRRVRRNIFPEQVVPEQVMPEVEAVEADQAPAYEEQPPQMELQLPEEAPLENNEPLGGLTMDILPHQLIDIIKNRILETGHRRMRFTDLCDYRSPRRKAASIFASLLVLEAQEYIKITGHHQGNPSETFIDGLDSLFE